MAKETALPLSFLARMAELLDEEFPQFLVKLNQPFVSALRVNTLKLSVAEFRVLSPWPLVPVPWCPEGFYLDRKANAGTHPYHDAGLYYIQEPSAMAVTALLAPQPGERVLDLCGSPGGKATHAAALLAGEGLLVANDIDRGRAEVLRHNLERLGTLNTLVLSESPRRLAKRWPGAFDRVIVDAPCSGEGMFRKKEEARFHWSEAHVAGCAIRQQDILTSAAELLRPGGRLVYATCTFAPEENEGSVWRFLQSHPDFELIEPTWRPGFMAGRPEWAEWPVAESGEWRVEGGEWRTKSGEWRTEGGEVDARMILDRTVRLWPHKVQGEGHFVALLQRMEGASSRRGTAGEVEAWEPAEAARLSAAERSAIEAFWQPLIGLALPERLLLYERDSQVSEVYALPPEAPDTTGLHVVRPGWHLGTFHTGTSRLGTGTSRPERGMCRFEPSHALAIALRAAEVNHRLDEPIGSELAARYLRGETLDVPGPDGWVLITVEGFPLGWGKRSGGVIKNHYPKALRWG